MLLGDLLARLTDESIAAEAILALGDLRLLAAAREEAQARGIDLGAFVAAAVQQYASQGSDEEWVTLMGEMGRASDPGVVCFRRAIVHALAQRA
jgi:hypothetical protein